MDQLDGDRPLPNSAGDTFDRPESDVASGEDPRHTRLQRLAAAMSNVTRAANLAKCNAAWPAEFAPPMTYTSCPAIAGASTPAAQ